MDYFLRFNWHDTFVPRYSFPEILVRGTAIYLSLLVTLRILPKRQAGSGTIASMLFVVLVGGTAATGMVGGTSSLTDVGLLVVTVVLWAYAVDWLSFHFPRFRHLVQEPPTRLVKDGRLIPRNLRREMISAEDLRIHLRRQNVNDLNQVQDAELEHDGTISVVTKKIIPQEPAAE